MRLSAVIALVATAGLTAIAGNADSSTPNTTYWRVRPDARLCPSPRCGGFFARRVNRPVTVCPDGTEAAACYVASIDWGLLSPPGREAALLFRGRLALGANEGFPELATLVVQEVWQPAGKTQPVGTFVRLRDNGVRCITTPCFSTTAAVLNGVATRPVSGVDLRRAGAPPAARAKALAAIARSSLLAAGTFRVIPNAGPAGRAVEFQATQAYLRLTP